MNKGRRCATHEEIRARRKNKGNHCRLDVAASNLKSNTKVCHKSYDGNKTTLLVILLILSLITLPISYSRYIERGNGKTQTSLAKWDVSLSPTTTNSADAPLELIAHSVTSADYVFTITSLSEVASDYSLILSNVPSDLTVVIDNNGTTLTPNAENKIIIDRLGGFEVGATTTTHTHTIKFATTTSTTTVTEAGSPLDVTYDVMIKQRISSTGGGE